ncbi:M48 family metallopeptidase [Kordiimonas pumila]|uniref:M48 family metallopeptidase n=1 Tax=Kordiimonas pumila TaxID=2161677 RepID=A0ABV7D0H0_9PROT|nr:SprT family zinc-dependent metalloprotease [Kordiimonas pumila]
MGADYTINLDGETVPVKIRRNVRAKKLILRVSQATGEIKLTLPPFTSIRAAERFISEHTAWLSTQWSAASPPPPLAHGDSLPFLGEAQTLLFTDRAPRTVKHLDETISVGGPADLAGKRLENWLKRQARDILMERATYHAATLGVSFRTISIGDMKSRWGSCSSSGMLRFNWRLVMAPFEVLDYVAAHEVAHLCEMNHSDKFWQHVATCMPDHKIWRRWLKRDGNSLFKINF